MHYHRDSRVWEQRLESEYKRNHFVLISHGVMALIAESNHQMMIVGKSLEKITWILKRVLLIKKKVISIRKQRERQEGRENFYIIFT